MNYIFLSPEEKYAQKLSTAHLQQAVHQVKSMGYTVLNRVYAEALVELWREEFVALLEAKVANFRRRFGGKVTANHDVNRWNMRIPSTSQLFLGEFFANPLVLQIISGVMGHDNYTPVFIASDVAFPNSTLQSIHQDGGEFAIAVNIPLVKVTMENGPTEIWAGTHRRSTATGQSVFTMEEMELSEKEIAKYVETVPNEYVTLDMGDISIRDLRMLHRGTVNHSNAARPYLSVIYYPVTRKVPYPFIISKATEKIKKYREKAFEMGKIEAIDWANMMGRHPNIAAYSDRAGKHTIPTEIAKHLSERAKYMLRFAQFDDNRQNLYPQTYGWRETFQFLRDFAYNARKFSRL